MTLLYRNGLFAGHGAPRALLSFSLRKSDENCITVKATWIRILLPLTGAGMRQGSISTSGCHRLAYGRGHRHPFTVTSWSRGRQDTIELLVQPRHDLFAYLLHHASVAAESSLSFLALFTGPHGTSEDVRHYESALVIASGFGVAPAIPYLRKMIYGYNTCTSQIRRLYLVWQVERLVRASS